jgi:hypothetical protein
LEPEVEQAPSVSDIAASNATESLRTS